MTVCLEMEKQLLSDVFVWLYTVMSRQAQDPSLPIIGDIVRRISLCNPPEKKNDFGRVERILMLGEAERLKTFETWPHKDYEYASNYFLRKFLRICFEYELSPWKQLIEVIGIFIKDLDRGDLYHQFLQYL